MYSRCFFKWLSLLTFCLVTEPSRLLAASNLVAHWALEEGSGTTAADSTGQGNTATLKNGAVWSSGVSGKGLQFNGVDALLEVPNSILANTRQSIAVWFNTSSSGVILGYQSSAYNGPLFNINPVLYVGTDGRLRGLFWNNIGHYITTSSSVADGQWHLAVLTCNVNTQSLYLDGNLVGSTSGNIDHLNMFFTQFGIGHTNGREASNGTWMGFDGKLDEIRIFNSPLTLQQVRSLLPPTAPTAVNDSYTLAPNQVLTVAVPGVLVNDSDANADELRAVALSNPAHGTLLLSSNGSFVYTPEPNYTGSDSFTYAANDGALNSSPATVYLQVGAVSAGLVAHWKLNESSGLIAPDSSGNNNTGTLTNGPIWQPNGGLFDGGLSFDGNNDHVVVPASSSLEPDSITVSAWAFITNSRANSLSDMVRKEVDFGNGYVLRWSNAAGRLEWRINRDNDPYGPPSIAVTDTQFNSAYVNGWHCFTGTFDAATGVSKLYVDGVLRASATGPAGPLDHSGNLHMMSPLLAGHAAIPGVLDDTLIFNRALTEAEVLALANRPPQAAANSYTFANNIVRTIAAPGVLGNDSDAEGTPFTAELGTAPAQGSVVLNPDGSFSFTPPTDYSGPPLSFTYFAVDGLGRRSKAASVTLSGPDQTLVTPVVSGASLTVDEDTPVSGTLSAADPNNDVLTFSVVVAPTRGTVALNPASGEFTYTPNVNANGADSFSFSASDGMHTSNAATISITINAINDAPVANVSASSEGRTPIGEQLLLDGSASTDAEGPLVLYEWNFGDGIEIATLSATIQHAWSIAGVYTATLTVTDVDGVENSSTVTIVVAAPGGAASAGMPDTDGDGFSDEMEIALGTLPSSALSTPINNVPLESSNDLNLNKFSIGLNLITFKKDTILVAGTLPIPSGYKPLNDTVIVNIGGVVKSFTLNEKGTDSTKPNLLKLQFKASKGQVLAQSAKFSLQLKSRTFRNELGSELGAGTKQKDAEGAVLVEVIFGNSYYARLAPVRITGTTKSVKAR